MTRGISEKTSTGIYCYQCNSDTCYNTPDFMLKVFSLQLPSSVCGIRRTWWITHSPPVFSALRLLTGMIMIMRAAAPGCGLSLFLYVRRGIIDYSSLSPDRTPSHVIYVWLRVSVHTLLMGDNNAACKANKKLRQSILGRPATPSRRNRRRMLGD